ncbi:NADH-quinone oxidoreductase subunit NuoE [Candidatus Latescibacterota bacterium]
MMIINNKLAREQDIRSFKVELLMRQKEDGALIPLLQSAQDSYGYIPKITIHYISEILQIPAADIYGVITFYSQFRTKPLGKYIIKICQGTACHVNGARLVLNAIKNELGIGVGETTDCGQFTLQSVACLGCCSLSPAMMINNKTYGSLSQKKITKILNQYMKD